MNASPKGLCMQEVAQLTVISNLPLEDVMVDFFIFWTATVAPARVEPVFASWTTPETFLCAIAEVESSKMPKSNNADWNSVDLFILS